MTLPILKIHTTSDFEKSLKDLPRNIQSLLERKDILFRSDAFHPQLKTHKLKGKLAGFWSYSINYHYRVLFRFITRDEVIYYDIGTHEIYR
ncbi:MAG: Plasmid maintenance system killer protein [Elusimicrobia bacterium ADurb.Bin231]|nr:MAG: Plasmid maintenance system killer protein [Elusimicrobia bacterium ADurb.Bin231]